MVDKPDVGILNGTGGYFRVFVQAPGQAKKDVTFFRGEPTKIGSMTSNDPFGDASASLAFPGITTMDRPGSGDLYWLVPLANVDIAFYNSDGTPSDWVWEGMIFSEEINDDYSVSCKGALYQLDNFLAAPWFPQYPVPYEYMIQRLMDPKRQTTLRTAPLQITFPDNWNTVVPNTALPEYLWFLRPWGVSPGTKWTGLTTRNTGGWEPVLTGYIQSLLGVMFTDDGGQWTIRKKTGRTPELLIRPALRYPTDNTLVIYNEAPGVKVSSSRDFSQATNVIYGQGTDLQGASFSGQQVTADGQTTYYEPFAALPQTFPVTGNPRFNANIPRKESRLQFPNGMSQLAARSTAAAQLRRNADPGYTGTISLTSDPTKGGIPYNRFLIKGGDSILVKNFRGTDVLFHITSVTVSPEEGTTSLTVDTKFRDALTVDEVRARTRDALEPERLLQVCKFSTTVQDSILPWSYTQGSGIIPSGGAVDATDLFTKKMGSTEKFPWTSTTRKYPPKKYPNYYIKINPKSANADNNWSGITRSGITKAAIPVRMSQQGTVRMIQLAAYDEDGNVMPVRFHAAFYGNSGISMSAMPRIPATTTKGTGGYPAAQRYPFFEGAFERMKANGTETDNPGVLLPDGNDLVVGWGNYYEGAGYSPGQQSLGNPKTGLLVDESNWQYSTMQDTGFDKYSVPNSRKNPTAGMLFVMIYCDDQGTKPVYFLGRIFRSEAAQ
jgi:hypothetical protein